MKNFVITSTNEAKNKAALQAIFEVFGSGNVFHKVPAPSGVKPTPLSDEECIRGARNRVKFARNSQPNADYYIGAEGGLCHIDNKWFIGGWVAVENKEGIEHLGSSARVELPSFIVEVINTDVPLSKVVVPENFPPDLYARRDTLGTNGLITAGIYTRVNEFYDALKVALSCFNLK